MRKFDCLSLDCPLLGAHILEASAGTGKTFSIEHIFVRLLLDPKEIDLEEILVVTFTRAATRELKARIRMNIEKAISFLKNGNASWDYLRQIEDPEKAIRILSDAVGLFDRAQIFTIHGFCYRMLKEFAFEADLGFSIANPDEERSIPKKIWRAAYKFLKEQIEPDLVSQEQIGLLLKKYDSLEELAEALFIKEDFSFVSFSDSWALYKKALSMWAGNSIEKEKLLEDFQKISPNYKTSIKGDFVFQVLSLASSFSDPADPLYFRNLIKEKGSLFEYLSISNRKVKFSEPSFLNYPLFFSWADKNLASLIEQACLEENILAALRGSWQKIAEPILLEEEWFNPDEILIRMETSVVKEAFASRIQNKYKAVIVDEFQDTDPSQWKIFRSLFLDSPDRLAALYLVGDPKQSIYRFRKADVYTYFKAREFLGEEALYRLDTNFRSSKKLISALNALFARNWLPLPQLQQTIPSLPVFAGLDPVSPFVDEKGDVHFILGEGSHSFFEESFLPYAISEIERLSSYTTSFSSYAILVKDRHQARAALELCQSRSIPAVAKSHIPLGQTFAFKSLFELLKAAAFPKDLSVQRIVQSGPFKSFPLGEGKILLEEKGLASFFHKLSLDSLDSEFEKDLRQMIEELLTWESQEGFSFEGLFRFLKQFEKLDASEGGRRRVEIDSDAVQILTLHISKGLEFDVVFALGLASRTPEAKEAQELDAEKLRQLYVAMTRAKLRLYVPILFSEKIGAPGSLSPSELFTKILEEQEGSLVPFFQKLSKTESISFENLPQPFVLSPPKYGLTPTLEKKSPLKAPIFQASSLLSFTSLAQSSSEPDFLKEPFPLVQDFTSHTIPKGKETGIFIHSIFERLFSSPQAVWRDFGAIETFVAQATEETTFSPWENAIIDMVWKTISQPLPPGFSLLDIEPQNIQTEMEFLFCSSPNFMKGFIDLVFYFEDKYYIVDWKTNWLGPDERAYSSLEKTMTSHDYWLQAALYTEALARHVKQFDIRPFQDIFGGAIYLFVRGPGVCHFIPDLTLIEKAIHGY